MLYRIRFNKSRGEPGRGTRDHVWRVFDETGKEWLCKAIRIAVESYSLKERDSEDWNIACVGKMVIDRENSTIEIVDDTI